MASEQDMELLRGYVRNAFSALLDGSHSKVQDEAIQLQESQVLRALAEVAQPSDTWDFIEAFVDQWTPIREIGRKGFDALERLEVREFLKAARAAHQQ